MAGHSEKFRQSIAAALEKAVNHHQNGDLGAAARAYRAILKRAPDHHDALHLLGLSAHQSGDHARAIRHMEKALALRPDEPIFLGNLGLAQQAAGQLPKAETCFRRALALAPGHPPARLNLGSILASQEQHQEALDIFLALIAEERPEPLWHAKAAQTLRMLGRLEEAETQFRNAVALAPRDMELLASLASLLQVRGLHDQAVSLYRQVLADRADYADVWVNLGNCLIARGEIEEARTAFTTALELDRNLEGAIVGIVYLLEREGAFEAAWARLKPSLPPKKPVSPAVAGAFATLSGRLDKDREAIALAEQSLAELIQADGGGGPSEMNLRFTIAKVYERIRDYDQAFAHLKSANALSRQVFEVAGFEPHITALMELFSAPEPDIVADNDDQTPVFIVGMPRSGTTLVEQILASHGDVHGGGELPHLFNAMDTMPLNNPDKIEFPQNLALADAFALNSAAQYYLDRLHQLAPCAARITDKLPGNILHVGIIARILPAARIIHIRRNAMDTCLSCFAQNLAKGCPSPRIWTIWRPIMQAMIASAVIGAKFYHHDGLNSPMKIWSPIRKVKAVGCWILLICHGTRWS